MDWQRLRKIIVPTATQMVLFPVLSLLGFIVLYRDSFSQKYFNSTILAQNLREQGYAQQLARLTDSGLSHTVVIVVFWSLIGFIAYTLIWGSINIMIEARNEVVVESTYTNKGARRLRVQAIVWQLATAIILVSFLLLSALVLSPIWIQLFGYWFLQPFSWLVLVEAIGAIVGASANLYVLWMLMQLVFALA